MHHANTGKKKIKKMFVNNGRLSILGSLPAVMANTSCITCAGITHYLLGD